MKVQHEVVSEGGDAQMTTRKADSVHIVAWLLSLLTGGDKWD